MITGLICGILLGFVMQRGRFCVTGAFRDMYVIKSSRMFTAFLIAITIQAIGLALFFETGVLTESPAENFAPLAVISGSFLFGVGIILAGGCATGTWYRAGEGLIGSWVALFFYMLFSAMMKSGVLLPVNQTLRGIEVNHRTIHESLGLSVWLLVGILTAVTAVLTLKHLLKKSAPLATLKPKKSGVSHLLFEKRWHPFITASLVGLIALLAWVLSVPTGRNFGLGITTPSANIIQFLVTGEGKYINWGVFLVLGIFAGAYIGAKGSHEFRLRLPDLNTILKSALGGVVMGIGASLAGGCSIGNGLVETAFFSWQGWVSLPVMIAGTWVGAYYTIIRPQQLKSTT